MHSGVDPWVEWLFLTAVAVTVAIFSAGVRSALRNRRTGLVLAGVGAAWMLIQFVLASGGFYLETDARPPRFPAAVLPAVLTMIAAFAYLPAREVVLRLPLDALTWIHVVRVPVEIVLWQLSLAGLFPPALTFEGRNFDVVAGLTAPLIAWFALRPGRLRPQALLLWHGACLGLVINIVSQAVLSVPSPFQVFGFDQPNVGVLYAPFIWLPAVIVPAVIFSHLAAIVQLAEKLHSEKNAPIARNFS